MKTITDNYKVFSISQNTNSFGLHGVIIVNRSGKTFEVGMSYLNLPKKDEIVPVQFEVVKRGDEDIVSKYPIYLNGGSIEIPQQKRDCPKEILKEIFPD